MTRLLKAQVEFASFSGLPEDSAINSWHFRDEEVEASPVVVSSICAALAQFYDGDIVVGGTTYQVDAWMSQYSLDGTLPVVTVYEVDPATGVSGSPIGTGDLLGFSTATSNPLPQECSVCLSFHGDLTGLFETFPAGAPGPAGDIHAKARKRGRIYIPFLNNGAIDGFTGRVKAAMVSTLVGSAARLMTSSEINDNNVFWSTYSKKNGAYYDVVGGWVDNAFDTQRRRGVAATSRSTF